MTLDLLYNEFTKMLCFEQEQIVNPSFEYVMGVLTFFETKNKPVNICFVNKPLIIFSSSIILCNFLTKIFVK